MSLHHLLAPGITTFISPLNYFPQARYVSDAGIESPANSLVLPLLLEFYNRTL